MKELTEAIFNRKETSAPAKRDTTPAETDSTGNISPKTVDPAETSDSTDESDQNPLLTSTTTEETIALPEAGAEPEAAEDSKPSDDSESEAESEAETETEPSLQEKLAASDWGDTRDDVRALLMAIVAEAVDGSFSQETIDLITRGADYDLDIARAAEEAEIRGRNASIEERFILEEESDGIPHPGGSGAPIRRSRHNSIFDLARSAY